MFAPPDLKPNNPRTPRISQTNACNRSKDKQTRPEPSELVRVLAIFFSLDSDFCGTANPFITTRIIIFTFLMSAAVAEAVLLNQRRLVGHDGRCAKANFRLVENCRIARRRLLRCTVRWGDGWSPNERVRVIFTRIWNVCRLVLESRTAFPCRRRRGRNHFCQLGIALQIVV